MKFTSVVLACLAALLMCNLAVSGMEVTMSPAESILLEAAQRHSAEAALASHSDSETDVAVDSHILSDAEAEAQARFEAESEGASDLESAQEVDAEELAAAEDAAALDADADIEDRMEMDSEMDSEADSFAEMDAEADAEDEAELQAHQQEEFMAGQSALLEVSQAPQAPSSFSGPPPSSSYSNPPPGPSDYQGPPPSFAPGAPAPQYNAPFQQQAAGPFGGPNAAQSGPPADLPSGLPPVGHDIPLPPGTNPNAPFAQDQEIVSKGVKAKTVVVKVPNPAAAGKFLKVRVPLPTKGKLAKKLAQGKGKKALGKQLKKALKQALGKSKLSKAEKKAVKKAAKKAVKKAKKAAKKAKKAAKKAKKAAKKAKKAKKLSKKARRAAKLKRAATKAATLNAKLLPKGQYTKRWTTIQVPNPAKAGKTTAAKVQVQVPIAGEADHTLRKIKAVIPKVEHRKLQVPGQKKPQDIKVTRYYKALRQAVVDPVNAGEVRTIDVQVEVKAPAQKPAAAIDNVSKLLEKKIKKKEKNIKALQRGLRTARRNVADSPVLEDGAPAPPDRQQVEMAQNLMKVLEATVLGRAKEIGEKYLNDARDMTVIADANHEAVQDFNIRMNAENVLPKETIDFGL